VAQKPPFNIKFVFPVMLLFCFCISTPLHAEQTKLLPEIQLLMMGNTLVAIDDVALFEPTDSNDSIRQQAELLEREILRRKLAESNDQTKELPVFTAQPLKGFKKSQSGPSSPVLSALSQPTLFDHIDQEIIDPFRSGDNFENFLTRIANHMKYNVGLFGEYNDNIFLTPDDKESDFITSLNQSLAIEYPMDNFYLEAIYNVILNFYGQGDETADIQTANFNLSYYPFDVLSFGVSDQFVKVGDTNIASDIGDQTISAGYLSNNLRPEVEIELWENGFFQMFWNYEHIDFSTEESSFFIDRDVHTLDVRLKHRWDTIISNYLGYRYMDVDFDNLTTKDSDSHILYYGLDYHVPGILTFFGEVGHESKEFDNTGGGLRVTSAGGTEGAITIDPFDIFIPFEPRREHDYNVNFLVGIQSNVSNFNAISLTYRSRLAVSSRSEFSQYLAKTFTVNSRHFIDSKTLLFPTLLLEVQSFDAKDSFDLLFPDGDATTKVFSTGLTLRRILKEWLFFDVGYFYSRRTTDFPGEANNVSRFRFGAEAIF